MAWQCLFVSFFLFFIFRKNICLCPIECMRRGLVCWLEGAMGVVVSDLVLLGLGKRRDLSAALKNPVELRLWLRLVCILMKLVTSSGNFQLKLVDLTIRWGLFFYCWVLCFIKTTMKYHKLHQIPFQLGHHPAKLDVNILGFLSHEQHSFNSSWNKNG